MPLQCPVHSSMITGHVLADERRALEELFDIVLKRPTKNIIICPCLEALKSQIGWLPTPDTDEKMTAIRTAAICASFLCRIEGNSCGMFYIGNPIFVTTNQLVNDMLRLYALFRLTFPVSELDLNAAALSIGNIKWEPNDPITAKKEHSIVPPNIAMIYGVAIRQALSVIPWEVGDDFIKNNWSELYGHSNDVADEKMIMEKLHGINWPTQPFCSETCSHREIEEIR